MSLAIWHNETVYFIKHHMTVYIKTIKSFGHIYAIGTNQLQIFFFYGLILLSELQNIVNFSRMCLPEGMRLWRWLPWIIGNEIKDVGIVKIHWKAEHQILSKSKDHLFANTNSNSKYYKWVKTLLHKTQKLKVFSTSPIA